MKIKGLNVLIAEDEPQQTKIMTEFLVGLGAQVFTAVNGNEALEKLTSHNQIELLITDLQMPQMDGLTLIKKAREQRDDLNIILMTAHGSIESAVQATKLGAADYLQKPIEFDELELRITKVLHLNALSRKTVILEKENERLSKFSSVVYQSPAMKKLFGDINKVLNVDTTVMLTGETGVGKEVIANYIHTHSHRSKGPFMAINCSAVPENLLESQFFGHEKGAFTGADRRVIGSFELANEGTLFLDEIGEMDLKLQAKILRALEERKITRMGHPQAIDIDVRIIAATNKDLKEMVDKKLFREDLYYRLKVVHFEIPSLRDRVEDIKPLTESFIEKEIGAKKKGHMSVDQEFFEILQKYSFPGNVRELRNLIERAVLFATNNTLTKDCLPKDFFSTKRVTAKEASEESRVSFVPGEKSLGDLVGEFEKSIVAAAVQNFGGDIESAAKSLQISRSALYAKLAKYGVT